MSCAIGLVRLSAAESAAAGLGAEAGAPGDAPGKPGERPGNADGPCGNRCSATSCTSDALARGSTESRPPSIRSVLEATANRTEPAGIGCSEVRAPGNPGGILGAAGDIAP